MRILNQKNMRERNKKGEKKNGGREVWREGYGDNSPWGDVLGLIV